MIEFQDIERDVELVVKGSDNHLVPRNVLIVGPHGCGKSTWLTRLAKKCEVVAKNTLCEYLDCVSLVLNVENDPHLTWLDDRDVVLVDHLEVLVNHDADGEFMQRVELVLKWLIGKITGQDGHGRRGVVVIGACSNLEDLDPRLKLFDMVRHVDPPGVEERATILESLLSEFCLVVERDDHREMARVLAKNTPGYVRGDLVRLVRDFQVKQRKTSIFEMVKETKPISSGAMFKRDMIQPVQEQNDPFASIAAYHNVKDRLENVLKPPKNNFGVKACNGVLFFGPSGCGKTLFGKALATIYVKPSDVVSKYVGESERKLRGLFQQARKMSPCILFFDEIDALGRSRFSGESENEVESRLLSTLLNEMDGISALERVTVLGATNVVDVLDPALVRRFTVKIPINLPQFNERKEIFRFFLRKGKCQEPEENLLYDLAQATKGKTGADIKTFCKEATMNLLREIIQGKPASQSSLVLERRHFDKLLIGKGIDDVFAPGETIMLM